MSDIRLDKAKLKDQLTELISTHNDNYKDRDFYAEQLNIDAQLLDELADEVEDDGRLEIYDISTKDGKDYWLKPTNTTNDFYGDRNYFGDSKQKDRYATYRTNGPNE